MQLYNTKTKQKEEFEPLEEIVKVYVCGPTVYDDIHIGNARPICAFDVLRRYLEYKGYNVNFVQNFTDVDDKIIKRANELGITAKELTDGCIERYNSVAKNLNIMPPTVSPRVSENMEDIIAFIKKLEDKGFTYTVSGDVYFKVRAFKDYGKLSKRNIDDMLSGARIDVSNVKQDPLDFALWKSAKPNEPFWESPWGDGRPGWHIECSVMSTKFLGETLDIHGGGSDLIFPHHENELAQSEAASEKEFSHFWIHNGFILVDGKKMSKSDGSFKYVCAEAEKHSYEAIRYFMINSQYRTPVNYTDEAIESCRNALDRLYNCRENLVRAIENSKNTDNTRYQSDYVTRFENAMDDDLNTPIALSVLFDLMREANILANADTAKSVLTDVLELFDKLTGVLGILYNKKEISAIPQEILELAEQRKSARLDKNFALADEIREKISALGYTIEETRQGTKITKSK